MLGTCLELTEGDLELSESRIVMIPIISIEGELSPQDREHILLHEGAFFKLEVVHWLGDDLKERGTPLMRGGAILFIQFPFLLYNSP